MTAALTVPVVDFEIPIEMVVLGLVTGLTYALLGLGLTLVYRISRVVSFAQGGLGALPALLVPVLVVNHGWSWWLAVPLALAAGAAGGALMEVAVIRRLARAPRLVVLVATIGVAQLLLVAELLVPKEGALASAVYPTPFQASWRVGDVRLGAGHLLILGVAPVLAAGLGLFLRRTRIGMASRAAADNRDAARLAGVPVGRVSLVVWAVAGLFAAAAAVLVGPTQPLLTQEAQGPNLMVRALAAAMIGGLTSFRGVFAGGVAIGVIELLVSWNYPTGGMIQVTLFGLILLALLARRDLGRLARGGEATSWSLAGAVRSLAPEVARLPAVVTARRAGVALLLGLAVVFPLAVDNSQRVLLSSVALFALAGLSVVVLTGFAGQVSLGQFAFVGLGAVVGGRMLQLGFPEWTALAYAAAAGGLAALLIGLPALRIRGLFLAVTSLGFAVASGGWLFRQEWLVRTSDGRSSLRIPRPEWFGVSFQSELRYCWLSIGALVLGLLLVNRLRASGLGRAMMAVRDNEPAAVTLSVPARRVKLTAFVVSGIIAGAAGYLYGGLLVTFSNYQQVFAPAQSLNLVAMVLFGGVTTVTGAVLGAIWVRGIPYAFGDNIGLLSSGIGLLAVLLVFPGGLAAAVFAARDRVLARLTGRAVEGAVPSSADAGIPRPRLPARPVPDDGATDAVIAALDVSVQFGGVTAVDGVTLTARRGEIVGLVGPNGAGKTTLFDVLSGQLRPASGRVALDGADVTLLRPEARALLGLGRTFQQARLFDDLRVIDALAVGLERHEPSEVVPSLLGLPPARAAERAKVARAAELIDLLGLGAFAHRRVAELSTGTRRIVELGCVLALDAHVLLLDEPAAGIAQREVEALAPVLREVQRHLGATLVLIEHDIPLVTQVADRLYVLASGVVVAEGDPRVLRHDPRVIAAYLGTDERVIERSGAGDGRQT